MSSGTSTAATQVSVDFDVVWVGQLTAPKAWAFRPTRGGGLAGLPALLNPFGESVKMPLLAFVVRHPSAGTILVDTGLHPDAVESLRSDYGLVNGLFFRTVRPAPGDFASQLRELGVEPEEIEQVVMTHLHADHTSGMRLLPAAEFVCSSAEWKAATRRGSEMNGYAGRHLPPAERMRLIDFESAGEPHGPFERSVDLLGDGSIRLVSTPGHTPGHLSVLLGSAGQPALLIGDAVYTLENLEKQILPFHTGDDDACRSSMRQINAFREAHPGATLIPTHDDNAWRRAGGAD